ncbi:MAG: hypothetical protein Q7J98_03690 [Kiritimatiellia bacterium]|nr:hypothetical protein [Kiritimatiellia bacterium]
MCSELRFRFIVPFLLFVMLMLIGGLIPTFPFGSDEGDNILGALSVLGGGDIYKAFYSQHMPFGYYFTALLALCGAESVPEFRIAYAVFLVLFWAWLYWSYARRVPPIMLIFLLIAFPLTAPFFLGHVILADNLSALALLVLLLELLGHRDSPELTPRRMAVISLASFVAVTSCFLSVYPVFAFIVGLVLLELRRNGWRLKCFPFRRCIFLAAAAALPFAILSGWYALTGNLGHFYYQAYEFNRTIYAKYVWGGGQPSPLAAFGMLPLIWIQHGISALRTALQNFTLSLDLLLVAGNLAFIIFIRRGWVFSIVLFLFLTYTGTRSFGGCGYTGFHSAPYFMVSLALLGWLIANLYQPRRARILVMVCLLVIFFKCTIPAYLGCTLPVYLRHIRSAQKLFSLDAFFATPYDKEIKALTKPGDMIWSAGIEGYVYINNRCMPASRIWCLVPWFAEDYGDEIVADLEKNRPQVIIFPADGMVWGHPLKDFGADIFHYIQARYRPLDINVPVKKDIYVLNDLSPCPP